MTDLKRPSTLTVRRPAGSGPTGTRPCASASQTVHKADGQQPAASGGGAHMLRSDTLLQGRSHVNIVHNGETYQLRATRLGKLILTK